MTGRCAIYFQLTLIIHIRPILPHIPLGTQHFINAESKLIQRYDVGSTLIQCCVGLLFFRPPPPPPTPQRHEI